MSRDTLKLPRKPAAEGGETRPTGRKPIRGGSMLSRPPKPPRPEKANDRADDKRPGRERPQGSPAKPRAEAGAGAPARPKSPGDRPWAGKPTGEGGPRAPRPFGERRDERTPRPERSRDATERSKFPPRKPAGEGGPTAPRPSGERRDERAPRPESSRDATERSKFPPRRPAREDADKPVPFWPGVSKPVAAESPAADTERRPRAERPARPKPAEPARAPAAAPAAAPTAASDAPHAPHAGGNEFPRLSKRMGELGLCSRREADEWIENGWVRVDGVVVDTLGARVSPRAKIEVDPAAKKHQSESVTILVHKPIGYVSGQAEDGYEPASVLIRPENRWAEDGSPKTFKPAHLRGLAPAGRLDIDSTGLLVFTQDGRVAKRLVGDDSNVEKEYLVRVEGELSDEGLKLLNHGLELDGVKLRPAHVSWQNEDQLRFVLREGRKRQIRRMCELVGLTVVGLKRVRIGSIPLAKLPVGQWRYLRFDEKF